MKIVIADDSPVMRQIVVRTLHQAGYDGHDLVEGLLGRDVTCAPGPAVDPAAEPGPTTAVYVDDANQLSAVVLRDPPLTAYIGAAPGLVPKCGAEAAIEDGEVSAALQENAAEVLNVLAAVLGDASGVHQRLYETYSAGEARPADVNAWSASAGSRRDLTLDVKGYGSGQMSIISAVTL